MIGALLITVPRCDERVSMAKLGVATRLGLTEKPIIFQCSEKDHDRQDDSYGRKKILVFRIHSSIYQLAHCDLSFAKPCCSATPIVGL